VHASTGNTPFYVNVMRHPRLPSMLGGVASSLSGGGSTVASEQPQRTADDVLSAAVTRSAPRSSRNERELSVPGTDIRDDSEQAGPAADEGDELKGFSSNALDFVQRRQAVIRFVQDAIAASVDRQKLNADNVGRGNMNEFKKGSLVLLATQNLPKHAVSDFGASKLAPRFIGPFTVLERHGNAYRLDIPSSMRLHPTFYVGRLKPYVQHESSRDDDSPERPGRPSRARSRERSECSISSRDRTRCSRQSVLPDQHQHGGLAPPASEQPSRRCETARAPQLDRAEHDRHGHSVDHTEGVFPPPPPPLRDATGSIRWIVERIVAHKKTNSQEVRFRIRWRGFPPHQDTWEPRNVLMEDVPEMVRAYEAHHNLQA
jgi:hypothetical protein